MRIYTERNLGSVWYQISKLHIYICRFVFCLSVSFISNIDSVSIHFLVSTRYIGIVSYKISKLHRFVFSLYIGIVLYQLSNCIDSFFLFIGIVSYHISELLLYQLVFFFFFVNRYRIKYTYIELDFVVRYSNTNNVCRSSVQRFNRLCCLLLGKVRVLRMLEHSNVVGVHEFFDQSPDYFYVVLKRMEGGVVLDRIVTKVGNPFLWGGCFVVVVVAEFCVSIYGYTKQQVL